MQVPERGHPGDTRMRSVFRPFNRVFRPAAFLFSAMSLLLATATVALAGNGNSPHAFRVIDKHGNLVGYSLTDNVVARQINGAWVTFYVHPATGIFDSRAIYVYYLTTDCSGTPYITHYSNFSEGTRVGSTLYYPTGAEELIPRSQKLVFGIGEEGVCSAAVANISGAFGVATTADVDSFGLEPPFKAVE
jgi:hypothetical protein